MVKRINCLNCGHLLYWMPELLKGNQPGYTFRCKELDCPHHNKIQDYILVKELLNPTKNPLGHLRLEGLEES